MNLLLQSADRTLVALSTEELACITNALNEVCNGIQIPEHEFQTRVGVTREILTAVLSDLRGEVHPARRANELVEVWADNSVMVRVVTAYGDPVELAEHEALELIERLKKAIDE